MSSFFTGDHSSLAELAGEAPPAPHVYDAEFFDDPDYQHDPEHARHVMEIMDAENDRARRKWFEQHPSQEYDEGFDKGYAQALADNSIDDTRD